MGFLRSLFKNKNRKAANGPIPQQGDVFIMPVMDDILGACRVIRSGNPKQNQKDRTDASESGVLVTLSAWMGTSPPDISEPKLKELLHKTYGKFKGEAEYIWIEKPIPNEFKLIGSVEPTPEELQVNCNKSAGWVWLSSIAKEQYKWDNVDNSEVIKVEAPKKRMVEVGNASCHGCRNLGGWQDGWVFKSSEKYLVEEHPNLQEFFSRKELPLLLPNNEKYAENINSDEDPYLQSKIHWALAYMHHPNPNVAVRVFRANIPFNYWPLYIEVIWFLLDPNDEVAKEAANTIWKFGIDLEKVYDRLTSRGIYQDQISRAIKFLELSCPEDSKAALNNIIVKRIKRF